MAKDRDTSMRIVSYGRQFRVIDTAIRDGLVLRTLETRQDAEAWVIAASHNPNNRR